MGNDPSLGCEHNEGYCRASICQTCQNWPDFEQRAVNDWNEKYPVGTEVVVWRDNGDALLTTTRSVAEVAASGYAWIWVNGIAGAYALMHVRPVKRLKDVQNGE